jgi:uncharacterized protein HemX
MSTELIVVIVAALLLGAVLVFGVWWPKRQAKRARLRDRLSTEAEGHHEQVVANTSRAREMSERTDDLEQKAATEREDAKRLRAEAATRERSAAELAAEAQQVSGSSQRARDAATRHDEKAAQAEQKLKKL